MSHESAGTQHGSRRGYLIGFGLSAVLTAAPFWLVMSGALGTPLATAIAIVLLALAQILVHTVCFLHLNTRAEGGWTMLAAVFTAVIIVIVIGASLWIMYHLNSNLMAMKPGEMPAF